MEYAYVHMHLVALNHSQISDWDPCLAAGTDDQRMSPEWPAIKTEGGDATSPTHIIRSVSPDAQPLTTSGPYRPESLLPPAGCRQHTSRQGIRYVGNAFRRRWESRCYTIQLVCGTMPAWANVCLGNDPTTWALRSDTQAHFPTDPTHCRTAA